MTPIDLTDYAYSSKKIPKNLLKHKPKTKQQPKMWKIAAAYALDFYAIVGATMLMTSIFELSVMNFMPSAKLMQAFTQSVGGQFTGYSLPMVMMGYYFFSYFFNDGQTWGMHSLKTRIHMPQKSFKSAIRWAVHSSLILWTCGLFFYVTKNSKAFKAWGSYETHDHLYDSLVEEREFYAMNLVQEAMKTPHVEEEETWEIAA